MGKLYTPGTGVGWAHSMSKVDNVPACKTRGQFTGSVRSQIGDILGFGSDIAILSQLLNSTR